MRSLFVSAVVVSSLFASAAFAANYSTPRNTRDAWRSVGQEVVAPAPKVDAAPVVEQKVTKKKKRKAKKAAAAPADAAKK